MGEGDERREEREAPQTPPGPEALRTPKEAPAARSGQEAAQPAPAGSAPAQASPAPAAPAGETAPAAPEGPAAAPQAPPEPERRLNLPLLFDRYSFDGIVVRDPGLRKYINVSPIAIPHTCGKHANRPFSKARVNIVERLINGIMRTEHATGEKARTYRIVKEAFRIIEERTKLNPIQVLVDAVTNASPREEVTRLKYGGISVPKAVDTSSCRRVNIALKHICQGALKASRSKSRRIEHALAEELILAARGDMGSFAMAKKGEIERVAASAR